MSRFHEPQHPDFQRLNSSLAFDRRLWPQDLAQSRAHASMLAARGIIAAVDRDALHAGLDAVESELALKLERWEKLETLNSPARAPVK